MVSSFVKVINVQVLTLATKDGIPDDKHRPILRFELEDGREFMMSGIPHDVAINISLELNGVQSQDSRLQIHDLIDELALLNKVEIDLLMPGTDVYQATIDLTPEGFERSVQFQMVPSHATLLAVVNNTPIFVADALIKKAESMQYQ